MATLSDWLIHRAKIMRLSWPDGVSDASGVAPALLDSIAVSGNLGHVGRGRCGFLARALKVSVRELEALAAGRIEWIADERLIDLDRRSPNAPRPTVSLVPPIKIACEPKLGIPIIGRILESGKVERLETCSPEDWPRLSVRFVGIPAAFALKLERSLRAFHSGECLVFQTILPGEMQEGEIVLLTRIEGEAESELFIVHWLGETRTHIELTHCGSGEAVAVGLSDILRAARVVGSWQT